MIDWGPTGAWACPKATSIPAPAHHGTSTSTCTNGYGPVTDPAKTDAPITPASRIARRIGSRGAPTSEMMAIRVAPRRREIAVPILPAPTPTRNRATTGNAVTAPTTGCRSGRRALRAAHADRGPALH